MAETLDVSCIIVNFNTKNLLKRCLDALDRGFTGSHVSHETIVVDNNSSDGSIGMVSHDYQNVILLKNSKNEGFGKANNQAIQKARGQYVLLLNSDCIAQPGSIAKLLGYIRSKKSAFAGGKLFNTDKTVQYSCGSFYTLPVVIESLFLQGDKLGITRYSPKTVRKVDWVSGACLIGQKDLFVRYPFDESIFMYMDEIDLLYRAHMKGIHTYFFPHARFIHVGAASSGSLKHPVLNIYRGLMYFYSKYFPGWQVNVLRVLLKVKALIALSVGFVTGNDDLKDTYVEALNTIK